MAESTFRKRQVAYKVNIKQLLEGKHVKEEGEFAPNYILVGNCQVARLNMVGFVVSKEDRDGVNYRSIILDDGTGKISIRSFEPSLLDSVEIGDKVLVIGRAREYAGEKYVVPEIIKKIDSCWIKVRKVELELAKRNGNADEYGVIKEEAVQPNTTERIFELINKLDRGEGADAEEVIANSREKDSDKIIESLLKNGDIFEVRPGKLKVL